MINIQNANIYCYEDISLIENYENAVADDTQMWELHHRLESDKNLSRKKLISMDMYFHRPASELIFLTPFEHRSLHHKDKPKSEETKSKMSETAKKRLPPTEESRKKNSESHKGKKVWNSGKTNVYSEETLIKMSESAKKRLPPSEETRKKIGIKSLGNKSSTGYKWVHDNKGRKMVKLDELEYYLNKGYKLGMK